MESREDWTRKALSQCAENLLGRRMENRSPSAVPAALFWFRSKIRRCEDLRHHHRFRKGGVRFFPQRGTRSYSSKRERTTSRKSFSPFQNPEAKSRESHGNIPASSARHNGPWTGNPSFTPPTSGAIQDSGVFPQKPKKLPRKSMTAAGIKQFRAAATRWPIRGLHTNSTFGNLVFNL